MPLNIPSLYRGEPDATFTCEPDEYGDSYRMTLTAADGHIIAEASGFRPGACQDFGDDASTADTFGSFLGHALEDAEFAAEWDTLADDAAEWADTLTLLIDTETER